MKCTYLLTLICFILFSCSQNKKAIDINEAKGQVVGISTPNSKSSLVEKNGIEIQGGKITNEYNIPNIKNIIMGIEDAYDTSTEIKEWYLVDSYKGFTIAAPKNIENIKEIRVVALCENKRFTKNYPLSVFDQYNELFGYISYVEFENKYWINMKGEWTIEVYNNDIKVLSTTYENLTPTVFYFNESDSPFDVIQVSDIEFDKSYTYRYLSDKKNILVVYYTNNDETYFPILVVAPDKEQLDNTIKIKWGINTEKGRYYICHYDYENIPKQEESLAIFNSISLN
jgi:hypothetical protein